MTARQTEGEEAAESSTHTGDRSSTDNLTVYVIRHGHRADKEPDYDGGWNTPLSTIGQEQAEHVAQFIAEDGLDAIYSSCQLRALQTAEPIHRETDAEWHSWPVFGEFANRTWRQLADENPEKASQVATWQTREPVDMDNNSEHKDMHGNYYLLSEIQERFPAVELSQPFPYPDAWWTAQSDHTRTNGVARIELGTQALLDRHEDGDRVAIACHTQSGAALVSTIAGLPNRHQYRRFSFDNAAVTRLERWDGNQWLIKYANRVDHLSSNLQI